ncbi:hypothetical protein BpHYR1_033860 [Brachionus plicatilis]|uniref:Uncharacterized protein n=1 Tax=Brachionus plicatilis TaxID=10195 RepID=A0A3M7SB85_BRAPC|nr:hypothetical protein BpHYR1_033860 [Brachionus plicatilis]
MFKCLNLILGHPKAYILAYAYTGYQFLFLQVHDQLAFVLFSGFNSFSEAILIIILEIQIVL